MSGRGRRHTILFLAGCALAAGSLAACGSRALQEPDAGGSGGATITGAGGAATTVGAGGGAGAGAIVGGAGAGGAVGAGGASANACASGATFSYLVRGLMTFERTGAGTHGFDLDGRVSDGSAPEDCRVSDGISPDGRRGIDNVLGGLWREDLSHSFDRSYAQGHFPIVVRLSGVDDFANDDCVDVEWFGAQWLASPIDPASLAAVGRELRREGPAARLAGARIEAGRLTAMGEGAIALRAAIETIDGPRDFVFPLTLSRLSFAPNVVELTGGDLGGHAQPDDVQGAYRTVFGTLFSRELVASILFPDLPSPQSPCALLSAGFGFEAVRVTIVP